MLRYLPGPLVGCVLMLVFAINTVFWFIPIFILSLIKRAMPTEGLRKILARRVDGAAQCWVGCNKVIAGTLLPTQYTVRGLENLSLQGQYLVISNHQTWNDIHVLQSRLYGKVPFIKFFLKQELIWVPVLGLAWWGLDFPFMKRHTAAEIAKNPGLRQVDIDTTRKACERFADMPVAIFNFLEGTRFTPRKHAQQQSPYRYLLKPKTGGLAFTLAAMGDRLQCLLDVTIAYPDGAMSFWQFMCGKVRTVIVDVRQVPIPANLLHGDYEDDPVFRQGMQDWVKALWDAKDQRMAALLSPSTT